jgi:hypothetical protein
MNKAILHKTANHAPAQIRVMPDETDSSLGAVECLPPLLLSFVKLLAIVNRPLAIKLKVGLTWPSRLDAAKLIFANLIRWFDLLPSPTDSSSKWPLKFSAASQKSVCFNVHPPRLPRLILVVAHCTNQCRLTVTMFLHKPNVALASTGIFWFVVINFPISRMSYHF